MSENPPPPGYAFVSAPMTISDTPWRVVVYAEKDIYGGSLVYYEWMNGDGVWVSMNDYPELIIGKLSRALADLYNREKAALEAICVPKEP